MKTDKELEDEAWEQAKKVYGGEVMLPFVHCTCCPVTEGKQHCVANLVEGTALCFKHFYLHRLDKLKAENKPQLDVADFAKV